MPNINRLLTEAFNLDCDLIAFEIHRRLKEAFPGQAVLVTDDWDFDLASFVHDGGCALWSIDDLESLLLAQWTGREKGTKLRPFHGFFEILWQGTVLRCLTVVSQCVRYTFLIADEADLARRFFEAVCIHCADSDRHVTVFDGRFRRDTDLETALKEASWYALVLPHEMKARLHRDVTSFFEAKDTYSRYGLEWKRGVLLHGAPGNGKTHAVRALLNLTGRPCLVVRSLTRERGQTGVRSRTEFSRGRERWRLRSWFSRTWTRW